MNTLIILVYSSLIAVNAILLVSIAFKKDKIVFDYLYMLLCFLIMGWAASEVAVHVLVYEYWILFFYTAKLAFVAFVPVVFFLLVARFYSMRDKVPRWFIGLTVAFASMTAILALTCMNHSLLRATQEVVSLEPLTVVSAIPGIWYYVNSVMCQVPIIAMIAIILTRRKKLPAAYRAGVTLLMVSLLLYVIGAAVFFSGVISFTGLDSNLISVTLINYLFYTAVSSNGRADYLNVWRRDVFDYLDEAILIINDKGLISDANEPAKRLFASVGLDVIGLPADRLEEEAVATGKVFSRQLEDESQAVYSNDLYVTDGKYPVVYSMTEYDIDTISQAGEGKYLFLTEVTLNRLYIERLRDSIGIDALTGLSNRYKYEQVLAQWDHAGNLPLSIIIGDVNGLKAVNDSRGHESGDELLKQVALAIQTSCPDEGMAARIGGDEFALLLKSHSEEEAARIIERIQEEVEGLPGIASDETPIALGCATKNALEENINVLIMQADATMYEDKKAGGETP